jgi:hypothetical protein
LIAALVALTGKDFPLGLVGDDFADHEAVWIGSAAFAIMMLALYRWVARLRA